MGVGDRDPAADRPAATGSPADGGAHRRGDARRRAVGRGPGARGGGVRRPGRCARAALTRAAGGRAGDGARRVDHQGGRPAARHPLRDGQDTDDAREGADAGGTGMTGTGSGHDLPRDEEAPAWHLEDDVLSRYATGRVSAAIAASAEAHLTTCTTCRARLAPAIPVARLDAIWDEVDQRVDTLSLPLFERALVRLGMGEDTARLL